MTTGNTDDSKAFRPLLKKLKVFKPIKGIWADGAYDDENLFHVEEGYDMGYLSLSKRNPRRNGKIVEQVFDILKK